MAEHEPGLFDRLLELLEALILPVWADLIALIPLILLAVALLFLGWMAWLWRRASVRNRPRMLPRLAAGAPPPGVHLPGPSRWPFVLPIGGTLIILAFVLPPRDAAGQVTFPVNLTLFGLGVLVTLVALAGWLVDAMREWRRTETEPADAHHQLAAGAAQQTALVPVHSPRHPVPAPAEVAAAPVIAEPPPGVHMPGPSPWPFFAPIGITVAFFGLILHPFLIVVGVMMGVIAAAGWLVESSREYHSVERVGHAVPHTRDPEKAWPRRLVPVFGALLALGLVVYTWPAMYGFLDSALRPVDASPTPLAVPARPEVAAFDARSFDRRVLIVPCCRPFELVFHNEDAGVLHDVVITEGPAAEIIYFNGEVFPGVATVVYEVPALDEGDYYFFCSVHPVTMTGTVQARPEQPPDALPPGPPVPGEPAPTP